MFESTHFLVGRTRAKGHKQGNQEGQEDAEKDLGAQGEKGENKGRKRVSTAKNLFTCNEIKLARKVKT